MISLEQYVRLSEAVPRNVDRERQRAFDDSAEQTESVVEESRSAVGSLSDDVLGVVSLIENAPSRIQSAFQGLRDSLSGAITGFGDRLKRIIGRGQDRALEIGQALIDRPLEVALVEFGAPQVVVAELDTLVTFARDLVDNVSAQALSAVVTQIGLAALEVQTLDQSITNIRRLIPPDGSDTGIGSRSATITRVEVSRVESFAAQQRLEQLEEQIPDLRKQWWHSGIPRVPRSGHVAISGTVVGINERFLVAPTVGGTREALLFPRDPAASARNSVRCRCRVLPFLERWQ